MNAAESEIRRLHLHKPCSECSLCILKPCTDSRNSQAHIQTRKITLNICEYAAFREPSGSSAPKLEFIGFCGCLFIYLLSVWLQREKQTYKTSAWCLWQFSVSRYWRVPAELDDVQVESLQSMSTDSIVFNRADSSSRKPEKTVNWQWNIEKKYLEKPNK